MKKTHLPVLQCLCALEVVVGQPFFSTVLTKMMVYPTVMETGTKRRVSLEKDNRIACENIRDWALGSTGQRITSEVHSAVGDNTH